MDDALVKAQKQIADQFGSAKWVHTVMIGTKMVGGKDTGEPAIICQVSKKMTAFKLSAVNTPLLPRTILVDGISIPVDVQVKPPPMDQRLYTDSRQFQSRAVTTHQRCHDAPMPGGVQIAPSVKNWVGTLGFALALPDGKYGAITNAHVTDLNGVGNRMIQPGPGTPVFAIVTRVVGIQFGQTANFIDAAVLDTFQGGTHTVRPTQLELGKIVPTAYDNPSLGDQVTKSGRTTGVTQGRCVGIEATSYVGYSEGTAKFERQIVVSGDRGNFSAGGDSGSLVLTRAMRPWGLLFAGGGGQTICNPIAFVLEWADGQLFQV